jgi:hypothetical protein
MEINSPRAYRDKMNGPWEEIATTFYNEAFNSKLSGNEGVKYDKDKPRIDLVDAEFLEGLGDVLRFGANKYAAHNWRGGIAYSRLIGAAYRHLGAINKGEDIDPESGMPHVYHLACCNMFLSWMMKHRKDLDDRYIQPA